jgi:hypothetical protein
MIRRIIEIDEERCTGCGHEVMKPRFQILPRVRSVECGEKQG